MTATAPGSPEEEVLDLRNRLEDLQQAMDAIRSGDVDAVVVGGPGGDQLYTHYSADRPYRVIVEEMGDGALTVSERGIVLYANERMAKLLGRDRAGLLGVDVAALVTDASSGTLTQLLGADPGATRRAELDLRGEQEAPVPVLASVTGLELDGAVVRCLIVADLTDERSAAAAVSAARQHILRQQLELQHEHELNDTFQRAVLPGRLPEAEGFRLAARYLPADRPSLVGGDWYDAFTRPDGTVALVVGDVVGHSRAAAATMGQMRNALRAYAFADEPADEVLRRLNALVISLSDGDLATAVLGVLDPARRTFHWANGGHPPPLVITPSGPRLLSAPPGMMIGAHPDAAYEDGLEQLADGDLLVLYSDGLVERRASDLDADTEALLAAAADLGGRAPDEVCAALIARLTPGSGPEDDVCVLVVHLTPSALPGSGAAGRHGATPST